MRAPIVLALAVALCGCSSLILRPDDGFAMRATKVTTRIVLALGTVFHSERAINGAQQREVSEAAWAAFHDDLPKAKTKADLVVLMGLPVTCQPLGEEFEACEWGDSMAVTTHGQETASVTEVSVVVNRGNSVTTRHGWTVTCIVPINGGEREPDTCRTRRY